MTDFDKKIENFEQAVDLIVYNLNADDEQVCRSAQVLYCLAHQRYVKNEKDGMNQLRQLVQTATFGKCPCLSCQNQFMIPFSPSNEPGITVLRSYCPKYGCVYGKDIAGLFMLNFPEYFLPGQVQQVKGQIYGFSLYKEHNM